METASTVKQHNGLSGQLAAATAELVRTGLADVTKLDDQLLGAVLVRAMDVGDRAVHAAVYPESEIRSMLCSWCASLLLRSPSGARRWRVVHEASCLLWQRYQQRAGGYTAVPFGAFWRGDQPWPEGAERMLANWPGSPCGAVVTWRGPYASEAAQQAARACAVRVSA